MWCFYQTLIPGEPTSRLFVDTNQTQLFKVDITDLTQDLIVTVNPLYGDPDIYMSRRSSMPGCVFYEPPSNVFPNDVCTNYTWSSTLSNLDVIQINHKNPCRSPPATSSCDASVDWQAGVYYIGVFGYNASMYDITVQVSSANYLVPGQQQTAVTSTGIPSFFAVQVRMAATVTCAACCC